MATIEVEVNPDLAQSYASAPEATQKKIQLWMNLWLPEFFNPDRQSLVSIMDEIGANAQARGLTPEILEDLLRENDHYESE